MIQATCNTKTARTGFCKVKLICNMKTAEEGFRNVYSTYNLKTAREGFIKCTTLLQCENNGENIWYDRGRMQ